VYLTTSRYVTLLSTILSILFYASSYTTIRYSTPFYANLAYPTLLSTLLYAFYANFGYPTLLSTLLYAFYATLDYPTLLSTLLHAFSRYPWLPYASFYATLRFFVRFYTLPSVLLSTAHSALFYVALFGSIYVLSTILSTSHLMLFYTLLSTLIYVAVCASFYATVDATLHFSLRCFLR